LWASWRTAREWHLGDAERDLGASLCAALVGQLIVLGTVAMIGLGPQVFWGVIGLCAAPWCAERMASRQVAVSRPSVRTRVRARTSAAV
jgi:hypothetical protein